MQIEKTALQGNHEWYEDNVIVNETLHRYGVIDGATSLNGYRGENGETGAYLAAQIVREELEHDQLSTSLKEAVLRANTALKMKMENAHIDINDPTALWSCALACVEIKPYHIDYVQAGDCMIVAKYKNGQIRLLTHDHVATVGEQSLALYKQYKAQGKYTHEEIVSLIKPKLAQNRYKANKVGGYSVLNGQTELAHFLEYGTINKNGLDALYIMSDGMFLPEFYYGKENEKWTKTVELLDKLTLTGYAQWLQNEEQEDNQCDTHLRLKISDDKTAMKLTFNDYF